jgi:hypothetical protein
MSIYNNFEVQGITEGFYFGIQPIHFMIFGSFRDINHSVDANWASVGVVFGLFVDGLVFAIISMIMYKLYLFARYGTLKPQ